jgi:hypothetical protein
MVIDGSMIESRFAILISIMESLEVRLVRKTMKPAAMALQAPFASTQVWARSCIRYEANRARQTFKSQERHPEYRGLEVHHREMSGHFGMPAMVGR